MKSHLKNGKEIIERVIIADEDTGEVISETIETKQIRYLAKSQEEFYLLYSSVLGLLQHTTQAEIRVFAWLLQNYKSIITLNAFVYKRIANDCEIAIGSVKNAITGLKEKRFIYSLEQSKYMNYKFNPRYIFKGSSKDRAKMLQFVLEHECPDC